MSLKTMLVANNEDLYERRVVLMLAPQGFFYGMALALVYVGGSALFLSAFGAEGVPYAYIAMGAFASLLFFGLAASLRRWPLVVVGGVTYAAMMFSVLGLRVMLMTQLKFVAAFVALMMFPLGEQILLVILGRQAGQLLDVRQMKRRFPLIVASYIAGFVTAAFGASALTNALGGSENLLILSGAAMMASTLFFGVALRRFGDKLSAVQQDDPRKPSKSMAQILRSRFTTGLFSYQWLSAIGSQLVIFIVLTQADARFSNPDDLARFFGSLGGARNVLNLFSLLLIVGPLLARLGLGFGLMANPLLIGALVLFMLVVDVSMGQAIPLFFALAVAAQVLDVVLTDGVTRTSIKTAYQALPHSERSTVETLVEGVGAPAAFAFTGFFLLAFAAIPGVTLTSALIFTLIVCGLWAAAGWYSYRNYAAALVKMLHRRVLPEKDLTLDDASTLAVIETMLQSGKLDQVRLALDVLEKSEHEALETSLLNLLKSDVDEIRIEALQRVERLRVLAAAEAVQACLTPETPALVRKEALQAYGALATTDSVDVLAFALRDADAVVREGALIGLLRYGGPTGEALAGAHLQKLAESPQPHRRQRLARIIGEGGAVHLHPMLKLLLSDEDNEVRREALLAAGRLQDPRLTADIVANLSRSDMRFTAMLALEMSAEAILPTVTRALSEQGAYSKDNVIRMVRACGRIRSKQVAHALEPFISHPDNEIQLAVLAALHMNGYQAPVGETERVRTVIREEVAHGLRTLMAREEVGEEAYTAPLLRSLDEELYQARRRVFLLLSFLYNPRTLARASEKLTGRVKSGQAIALETVEVLLAGDLKALVLPLIDPRLSPKQRIDELNKHFSLPRRLREERLREIIENSHNVWTHDWTRACAIYAAGGLGLSSLAEVIRPLQFEAPHPIPETARWAMERFSQDRPDRPM
ncbi:MAG: hypothetical protein GXP42_07095 [Chloroflexi bacterium]|nr:hypothetical protein [Chloroflexota bacterium]